MTRTGIIAPMPVEAARLVPPTALEPVQTDGGFAFYQWESADQTVFLVCSGIGMRRAAQAAQQLIEQFRVKRVVVSGVAGGLLPGSRTGTVILPQAVQAYNHVATRGFIAQGLTGDEFLGPTYPVDPILRDAALAACRSEPTGGLLVSARGLVTSVPILDWFRNELLATAVDMESASVAAVCTDAHVPFLIVRAVSDHAPELAQWDWPGLAQARKLGRLSLVSYFARHPRLAARLWSMKQDVDRAAREAARVVKHILTT